jgi:hypothetical protein
MQVRVTLAAAEFRSPACLDLCKASLVVGVVVIVRIAVAAALPVILTGLVAPKLKVGGLAAPCGPDVTAAESVTLPVNPPAGVRVIVDVFPVVAPGAIATAEPVIVKLAGAVAPLTVNESGTVGEIWPLVPPIVMLYVPP